MSQNEKSRTFTYNESGQLLTVKDIDGVASYISNELLSGNYPTLTLAPGHSVDLYKVDEDNNNLGFVQSVAAHFMVISDISKSSTGYLITVTTWGKKRVIYLEEELKVTIEFGLSSGNFSGGG